MTRWIALGAALTACTPPHPADPTPTGPDAPATSTPADPTGPTGDTATPLPEPEVTFRAVLRDDNRVVLSWTLPEDVVGPVVTLFDVGEIEARCDGEPGCSHETWVTGGGMHEYTLRVVHEDGRLTHVGAAVEVPGIPAPAWTVTSTVAPLSKAYNTVVIDVLAPGAHTLSWDATAVFRAEFVRLRRPDSGFGPGERLALTGSVDVPPDELARVGTSSWTLAACLRPSDSDVELCSEARPLSLRTEPGWLTGARRVDVDRTVGHTVAWQSAGNLHHVASETLELDAWTTDPLYTFEPDALTPGVHEIVITPCRWVGEDFRCSNRHDVATPVAGTVLYQDLAFGNTEPRYALEGETVAEIHPATGPVQALVAPRSGTVIELVEDKATITVDEPVFAIVTAEQLRVSLVVDPSVTWEERRYDEDFTQARALSGWPWALTGQPLDIAVTDAGDMWAVGEFSRRLVQGSGDRVIPHTYPLHHVWDDALGRYRPVRPFANPLNGRSPSDTSALGEKVLVAADGAVWSTQGGRNLSSGGEVPNHSRIHRFDPSGVDDPETLHDDRHCSYPVPGDGNIVIGLAVDGDRVWFTELLPGRLTWFDRAPEHCEPLLDYDDPDAVAAAALRACEGAETAADGCVDSVSLGAGVWPAHVSLDPVDGSPWVVDSLGNWLLHYAPAGDRLDAYPIPAPISAGTLVQAIFKGFPWQLRVTADAVYVGEYSDVSLLRFDRASEQFDELAAPWATTDMNLHSIDIADDRLWFALTNEVYAPLDHNVSTIGYVDLASWRAGTPHGVLYTGLHEIVDPLVPERDHWHASFRGIDVSPDGRYVAIASMRRNAMVRLGP